MYISRVAIDSRHRKKTKDLTHLGAYHNWVESCFPGEILEGIRSRKLWRIDVLQDTKYLLIVSSEKPDVKLLETYGIPGSAQSKKYDTYLGTIKDNSEYRFRVTLNPVKALSQGAEKRGRIVPEITVEDQMRFLEVRAQQYGFELFPGECRIVERGWEPFKKQGQKMIRLSKATYEGRLKVVDKDVFYKALTEGMGKKKAYGFGLMTIIPV